MMNQIKRFVTEEKGQGMTEYGLILGLIALGAVAAMTAFKDEISSAFGKVSTGLRNGIPGQQ